jgi:hypothetical protein
MAEPETRWVCTDCKEPGPEPAMKLLDGSYGSQWCLPCKKKRIFHKEVNRDRRST